MLTIIKWVKRLLARLRIRPLLTFQEQLAQEYLYSRSQIQWVYERLSKNKFATLQVLECATDLELLDPRPVALDYIDFLQRRQERQALLARITQEREQGNE
jgi:hypothetical protein